MISRSKILISLISIWACCAIPFFVNSVSATELCSKVVPGSENVAITSHNIDQNGGIAVIQKLGCLRLCESKFEPRKQREIDIATNKHCRSLYWFLYWKDSNPPQLRFVLNKYSNFIMTVLGWRLPNIANLYFYRHLAPSTKIPG